MENTSTTSSQIAGNESPVRTVIITGANGNLGSAVVKTFLDKGYTVIATVRDMVKDAIVPHEKLEVQAVDLSNEEEAGKFVTGVIEKHKQLHAVLMLVGGFTAGDIAATPGDVIKQQIALNFETAYYVARPAFAHMLQQNYGRLVFIGARPAIKASQGKNLVAYALSKSLLFKLAELLNESAKGKNVTTTVIAPSTLDTPLNRKSMPDTNPADWVSPQKLAELLEFTVSDNSSILRETVLKAYNNS